MAQEIGRAYVEIAPSTRGLSKKIEGEFDGTFDNVEKRASGRFRSLFGTVAKVGVGAFAAIGAFATGKILHGGLSRLLNIEDAQAKLRGLGHDMQSIEQIMGDALASVRGTAFGLGTAATVASTAVAAGIEPGKELEKYLRLTADAATIAGVSMEEMGAILNKTTTSGKVYTQELNQLADRGLPVFQWLQDEYQVTAEELRKMVAAGQVDAETFRRVIEDNIGGAALASGDTTRGALANVGAAFGRLGAAVMSAPFPLLKDLFGEVIVIVDGLNDRLGPLIERLSGGMAESVGPALDGLGERVLGFIDAFTSGESSLGGFLAVLSPIGQILAGAMPILSELGGVLREVGAALGGALAQLLPVVADALLAILGAVAPLLPALGELVSNLVAGLAPVIPPIVEALRGVLDVIVALLPVLGGALLSIVASLTPVLEVLADGIMVLVTALAPLLPIVAEVAAQLLTLAADVLVQLVDVLAPVVALILELAADLIPMLAGVVGTLLTALSPIIDVIGVLVTALMPIVEILAELAGDVLTLLVGMLLEVLPPVAELISLLVGALAPILSTVAQIIGAVLAPIIRVLATVITTLVGWLSTAYTWLADKIISALRSVIEWFQSGGGALGDFVRDGVARIAEFASNVVENIGNVITWFRELPDRIKAVFAGAGDWLKDAARRIIQGFIDGLKNAFQRVKDTLSGLTKLLPDWKGPAELDRRILRQSGRLVIDGFRMGLVDEFPSVHAALAGLTDNLAASIDGTLGTGDVVIVDANRELIGRMRLEAGGVLSGRLSPVSVGRAAW